MKKKIVCLFNLLIYYDLPAHINVRLSAIPGISEVEFVLLPLSEHFRVLLFELFVREVVKLFGANLVQRGFYLLRGFDMLNALMGTN